MESPGAERRSLWRHKKGGEHNRSPNGACIAAARVWGERTIVGRGNDIYDLVCDEYPCRWLLNDKGRDASLCSLAVLAELQLALHLTLAIIRKGDDE